MMGTDIAENVRKSAVQLFQSGKTHHQRRGVFPLESDDTSQEDDPAGREVEDPSAACSQPDHLSAAHQIPASGMASS